jgi:DNA gyrase/topoisomerase IV subunit B
VRLERHEFDERDLIERVMRNMQGTSRYGTPRWVLVRDAFGVGSTVANALCHEFDLNPDDELKKRPA